MDEESACHILRAAGLFSCLFLPGALSCLVACFAYLRRTNSFWKSMNCCSFRLPLDCPHSSSIFSFLYSSSARSRFRISCRIQIRRQFLILPPFQGSSHGCLHDHCTLIFHFP